MTDREALRNTFGGVAELYDRVRPGYPPALFDDIAAIAGLAPDSRVLEIGCGTGLATQPLAERRFAVTALELRDEMAAVARAKLAQFPNVLIETAAFERWPLPSEPFDLVASAQAFHWIDPDVRFHKTVQALTPSGWLALF